MSMQNKTIIITGGHHNSALVVAQALKKKNFHIIWFGHRFAARGDTQDSAEYQEVTKAGLSFYELKAGKMSAMPTIMEILNIPLGLLRAYGMLRKQPVAAVLSFGGYLGFATAVAAYMLKIPVYIHEQTMVPGKTTQVTARFAHKIYLTWNSSARYFLTPKALITGLPLRISLLKAKPEKVFKNNRPTLLIMGGKQGSHRINEVIFKALPKLTKFYNVIHQTGTSSVTGDYQRARSLMTQTYLPYGYIGEENMGKYLAVADLVVARSGAHTAYELALLGKRSILIPYLATTGKEQLRQAELLRAAGIASILMEDELTSAKLLQEVQTNMHLEKPVPLSLPHDATERLVSDLLADLQYIYG